MISQLSHVMTLANSIIGVSVLAMPFCFKQCGIVLATLVLLLSSVLSRLACHFLVKSAVMSRRRNFELLAFHSFGHTGKVLVELFIIGFLVGTCIAFFVVMGDLGPQIIGKIIDKNPEDIRTSLLITTSVFIVLPLGLLRNIDSLSSISTATIGFYLCLVLKIIAESMQHIFDEDWYEHVYYWRPSGILQCIPIFSMALFCQTQLFQIYETIPNVSLEKMNEVVRGALNICTIVYLCVGFFGYIAFYTQSFTGNILMSFEPSLTSEVIKMGFVFSIAFSFPLVIFPCRASLNSLLFRRLYTHEQSTNYLPEARFRCLTIAIVAISLITGILIPNIEFVLGLVGSTIGVMICLIFPAIFFISISSKHTNERIIAQAILFIGICIMVLSTYANLYAMEESTNTKALVTTSKPLNQINDLLLNSNSGNVDGMENIPNHPAVLSAIQEKANQLSDLNILDKPLDTLTKDVRREPPIPVERIVVTEKSAVDTQKSVENLVATFSPEIEKIVEKIKTLHENLQEVPKIKMENNNAMLVESVTSKVGEKIVSEQNKKSANMQKNDNLINSDAIKKEESELAADAESANMMAADRHEKLRKTLEKHKLEQLQMMQEQKEILKDIKEQKQEIEREKQRIAKDVQGSKENEERVKNLDNEFTPMKKIYNLENLNNDNEILTDIKKKDDVQVFKAEPQEVQIKERVGSINLKEDVKSQAEKDEKESERNPKHANLNNEINVKRDITGDRVFNKTSLDSEILNNKISHDKKLEKSEGKLINPRRLPKGPILNALSKRTLQKSISNDELSNNENNLQSSRDTKTNSDNVAHIGPHMSELKSKNQNIHDKYSLPIALKMRNQTKMDYTSETLSNKTQENIKAIRRDILEDHEREKREVDVKSNEIKINIELSTDTTDKKVIESAVKNVTSNSVNEEKCLKPREISKERLMTDKKTTDRILSETGTTELPLIKTNVYLSEQDFADAISVDANGAVRADYIQMKQRDLKAVNAIVNSEI